MALPIDRYLSQDYLAQNPDWDQGDSPWKAAQVKKMLELQQINPQSICEIGCGAGAVLASLRQDFPDTELFGYDIAPSLPDFWQRHEKQNIQFEVGDFVTDNQRDYDVILLLDLLEHLQDPFSFLHHIKNKSGYLMVHFPLDLSAISVLREKPLMHVRDKVGHIHYYTKSLALALLEESGYEIVSHHFTGAFASVPARSWRTKLASIPRLMAYAINKDFGVRLFGGETLMVLAKGRDD